jgi:hypothetical protein
MIPSKISRTVYGRSVSTHSNSEQRPTCKMTPEQLLGLISIIDPSAIVAEGTQESVPIIITEDEIYEIVEPNPELREVSLATKSRPGPLGAVVGFALFAAVTAAEILVVALS